jgi:hypothetical protein
MEANIRSSDSSERRWELVSIASGDEGDPDSVTKASVATAAAAMSDVPEPVLEFILSHLSPYRDLPESRLVSRNWFIASRSEYPTWFYLFEFF